MPKYDWPLDIYLTGAEMEDLIKCITGEDDLYCDHQPLFLKLLDYYTPEIPYGTAMFKDGDADLWIVNRTQSDLGMKWVKGESGNMILVDNKGVIIP